MNCDYYVSSEQLGIVRHISVHGRISLPREFLREFGAADKPRRVGIVAATETHVALRLPPPHDGSMGTTSIDRLGRLYLSREICDRMSLALCDDSAKNPAFECFAWRDGTVVLRKRR